MREKYFKLLLENFTAKEIYELVADLECTGVGSSDVLELMFIWIQGIQKDKIEELLLIDGSDFEVKCLKKGKFNDIIEYASHPNYWKAHKQRLKELL